MVKYVIITPVRDEEKHVESTLKSVVSQTVRPIEWIIVDDGSRDQTADIVARYTRQFPWIRSVQREDRGYRKAGGGVVDAFYEGYRIIDAKDWEYIVKLDGDLLFDETYFENCLREFAKNWKLGIGGGTIYNHVNGQYQLERSPPFHVRGATKIYRKECWQDIGELLRAPGWDTLDEIKANMCGWETMSFAGIRLYQLRITGGAVGQWRNFVKNGMANYVSGYHPLFMLLKCLKRVFQKPRIVGGIALMYGYLSGYAKKVKRVDDKNLIRYIREQQVNRLLLRHSIWKY